MSGDIFPNRRVVGTTSVVTSCEPKHCDQYLFVVESIDNGRNRAPALQSVGEQVQLEIAFCLELVTQKEKHG